MGATTLGSAIGMFSLPPAVELFFDQYGYQGGMLMFAGLTLHGFAAAALFFPLKMKEDCGKNTGCSHQGNADITHTALSNEPKILAKTGDEKKTIFLRRILHSLAVYFSLLKKPFLLGMGWVNFSIFFTMYFVGSFLPALAVDHGASVGKAAVLITAIGGMDTLAKIISTLTFDLNGVRRFRIQIYVLLGVLSGIGSFVIPFSSDYVILLVLCSFFGSVHGVVGGQRTTILADLVKSTDMPHALGLMVVFDSVGCVVGGLVAGKYKIISSHCMVRRGSGGVGCSTPSHWAPKERKRRIQAIKGSMYQEDNLWGFFF